MSTFGRYVAFQVPGWILAACLAAWLWRRLDVAPWLAGLGVGAWMVKDLVLYPLVRSAYGSAPTGTERLIGAVCTTTSALDPIGHVRVGAELWRARAVDAERIAAGERALVVGAEGLTLEVRPQSGDDGAPERSAEGLARNRRAC